METSELSEVKSNGTWRSVAIGLIALVFMALVQYAALGFNTPTRKEVSDQLAEVKAESAERVRKLEEKIDSIQSDTNALKIQAERTNTLMELYIRSVQNAQRGKN